LGMKIEIRQNYEKWKPALRDYPEDHAVVKRVLLEQGIDVNQPIPEIPKEEKSPNWIERKIEEGKTAISGLFKGEGDKKVEDAMKSYKEGIAPKPVVSDNEKAAMVSTMGKDELIAEMKKTDRSDPIYQIMWDRLIEKGWMPK